MDLINYAKIKTLEAQINSFATKVIAESGSNINGEYVRFAEGTQICWGKLVGTDGANSISDTWIFPASFKTGSLVSGFISGAPEFTTSTGSSTNNRNMISSRFTSTSLSANVAIEITETVNADRHIEARIMAIGRWK